MEDGDAGSVVVLVDAITRTSRLPLFGFPHGQEADDLFAELDVKVDVDGDGQPDDKQYVVQHRLFYVTPSEKDQQKQKLAKQ